MTKNCHWLWVLSISLLWVGHVSAENATDNQDAIQQPAVTTSPRTRQDIIHERQQLFRATKKREAAMSKENSQIRALHLQIAELRRQIRAIMETDIEYKQLVDRQKALGHELRALTKQHGVPRPPSHESVRTKHSGPATAPTLPPSPAATTISGTQQSTHKPASEPGVSPD